MSHNIINNLIDAFANLRTDEQTLAENQNIIQNSDLIPTQNLNSDNTQLQNLEPISNITSIMSLPTIAVRDYLDLIPPFDGQPTRLSTFLSACENVLLLMAPNNELSRIGFTMLHIRTKLVGKAGILLANRTFQTFPELKTALIDLFGDQRNEESLLADLNSLKQRSQESATQFADRCIDLRSLLFSKLECNEELPAIKASKKLMYENMTLRAYLTGLNHNLSYLIRCQKPYSIEDAIRMAIEEENINYHRQRLSNNPNSPQKPQNSAPPVKHQLRINPTPVRKQQPINTSTPPQRNYQNQSSSQQTNHQSRPPPFRQPFNHNNQQRNIPHSNRSQTNVFAPKSTPQPRPTPMDTSSGNTRQQSINAPRWTSTEVYTQDEENYINPEENPEIPEENYDNFPEQYFYEENYNQEENLSEDYSQDENFTQKASTSRTKT